MALAPFLVSNSDPVTFEPRHTRMLRRIPSLMHVRWQPRSGLELAAGDSEQVFRSTKEWSGADTRI